MVPRVLTSLPEQSGQYTGTTAGVRDQNHLIIYCRRQS